MARRRNPDTKRNQERLQPRKFAELDTHDWEECNSEAAKLILGAEYKVLEEYHSNLAAMKSKTTVDDAALRATLALGTKSQGISNKYSTGWRRFSGLCRKL